MTNVAQRENKPSTPDLRTVPQGGSVDAVTTRASTDSAQSLQVPSRVEIAGALAGHKETLREQGKVLSEVLTALSSIEAARKQSEQSISPPPLPGRIEDVTSYSIPQLEQLYARTCKDLSEQTKGLALLHQKFSRAKEEFEAETTSADGLGSGERYAQRASALLSLAVSYKSLHSTFAVTDSNHRELVSAIAERFLKEQGFNSSSDLLKAT